MASEDFEKKLKRNVAQNFNQSYHLYHSFEDKHRLFETLALALATVIELPERSDVLDVGCGSGISARALNEKYGCRVLGVDLSEKMVVAGRSLCKSDDIRLVVGDGERLCSIAGRRRFDCVVYNASIFIFPDASRSIEEAAACLKPGGAIAFSYYPDILNASGEDLIPRLFERIGRPAPKFRVIADYHQICQAIERHCGPLRHHSWQLPLDADFLIDFFSIPAQSASLFPGCDVTTRRELVRCLFSDLQAVARKGSIVWRLSGAQKKK